jgi:site-specific DNA-methyltransferase (adenine-specific)
MLIMAEYPDNYFDLAIVDPPYGINIAKNNQIGYNGFNVFTPKKWDEQTPNIVGFPLASTRGIGLKLS